MFERWISHLGWGEPDQTGRAVFSTQWRRLTGIQHSKVSVPSFKSSQTNVWSRGYGGRFRVTDSWFLLLRTSGPSDQVYTSESRNTSIEERDELVESGFLEVSVEDGGAKDSR